VDKVIGAPEHGLGIQCALGRDKVVYEVFERLWAILIKRASGAGAAG
jgi:hypothetical protein